MECFCQKLDINKKVLYSQLTNNERKNVSLQTDKSEFTMMNTNYKVIDRDKYYRKGVFRHFSEDCKCSTSITARIDVTELASYSKKTGTKFYINFLYILSNVMNSREDYRMGYLWQTDELICYDVINPTQYAIQNTLRTMKSSMLLLCGMLKRQRKQGNTDWIWLTTRTGLMHRSYHGSRTIR